MRVRRRMHVACSAAVILLGACSGGNDAASRSPGSAASSTAPASSALPASATSPSQGASSAAPASSSSPASESAPSQGASSTAPGNPVTAPVANLNYLPALFAGLNIPLANCGNNHSGAVRINDDGGVTGSGCLAKTDLPAGSTYSYSQTPNVTNDYLSIHVGSTGSRVLADFDRDITNPQTLAVHVEDLSQVGNFIWGYPAGPRIRIDTLARVISALSYVANQTCRATINNVTVSNNAHLEINAAIVSIRQDATVIASAPLSELGTTGNITYLEHYGVFAPTTDHFDMAASGQGNQAQVFNLLTLLLNHKSITTQFQFNARSFLDASGNRVSVSCLSP